MPFNILIVDDSNPMRAVIKKVIKASGFDIGQFHEAGSGKEALRILDEQWLDLVLSDYNMPEMNGIEMLKQMKQNEMWKDIPVIMVTTEGSKRRIEEFMRTGASAYIKKPFTPEQIRCQLNQLLGEPEYGHIGNDPGDEGLDF
ncbi:MAG: response regulator [Desulfobacteraceae bacterium]|jgi:two-component system chemotaxis response regulator CheY